MSGPLPAELPPGFSIEPATPAHADEVFAILFAEQTAAFGFCPDTVEDVRAWLNPPATSRRLAHLVRDADERPVQSWQVIHLRGDPAVHAVIPTHPDLAERDSDALAATGWRVILDWIGTDPPDGEGPVEVRTGLPAGSVAAQRHLTSAGFTHARTFWEMLGPVTPASRRGPEVEGLTITVAEDLRTFHRVLDDAFAGHWGHVAKSFEDWYEVEQSEPGLDQSLWFMAEIHGSPAAAMVLSHRIESEGALYVQELATLPAFRRRGLASALLAHAFELAAGSGLANLSLHVDSENTHDAPGVYRAAGLQVRCAFHAFNQWLPREAPAPLVDASGTRSGSAAPA